MKYLLFLLAAFLLVFRPGFCEARPAQVILIRHGEKNEPDEGIHLSEKGFARARALVSYFSSNSEVLRKGPIRAFFAMMPKDESGSRRAIETLEPSSRALGIPVRSGFKRGEYPAMVAQILSEPSFSGGTVVICWEHKVIPPIAKALGAEQAPSLWDGAVYDRAWFLDLGTPEVLFRNLPENVLPGDST